MCCVLVWCVWVFVVSVCFGALRLERRACRKRRRVGTGTDGRHGGLGAAGAPLPSVLVCVLRKIV